MSRSSRKIEHIQHAITTGQLDQHGFDDVRIVHNCLPDLAVTEVDIRTKIGELNLSSPIVINAMTGGAEETLRINQELAIVSREKGLAMAVGSQMAAIKEPSVAKTYKVVREENPRGIIFANLGSEATVEQAQRAVDMLQADALQIHLNVIQELVMPEGDRSFSGALSRIEQIVKHMSCPIIVKEVGFGMSADAAKKLEGVGVQILDVGGYGGTNFAHIENKRRDLPYEDFNQWGINTVQSTVEVCTSVAVDVIASGGIKTPSQILKSILLGAKAVGIAGFILPYIMRNEIKNLHKMIDTYHEQLRFMMCALGMRNIEESKYIPIVLQGETYHWLNQRGFQPEKFAQRKR